MITAMPRIAVATRNFAACVDDYRDVLGLTVVDLSANSVDGLGARLAMCVPDGGSNIELMSPGRADASLAQSGRWLQKPSDRMGVAPARVGALGIVRRAP
jgi:catechol 2,3-dioxygenase-like lactoylglutathione lyase family enzyme